MRLLLAESLRYWREGHLHSSIPLWKLVYFSTLRGLDIWDGNGGVLGPCRMRSMNLKSKWNLPQLLLKAHQCNLHHLLLNSKFSNSQRQVHRLEKGTVIIVVIQNSWSELLLKGVIREENMFGSLRIAIFYENAIFYYSFFLSFFICNFLKKFL